MTTSHKLSQEFEAMRFDVAHHIGLGDIRITRAQQEDIVQQVQKLEHQLWLAEGALQEVRSLLNQAEALHARVDATLSNIHI